MEFLLKTASLGQEAEFLVLTDCPSGPDRTIVPQSGRGGDEGSPWLKCQILTVLQRFSRYFLYIFNVLYAFGHFPIPLNDCFWQFYAVLFSLFGEKIYQTSFTQPFQKFCPPCYVSLVGLYNFSNFPHLFHSHC